MLVFMIIWALAANWFAYSKGFYTFPKGSDRISLPISIQQLLIVFGLYLFLSLAMIPIFVHFFRWYLAPKYTQLSILTIITIQFVLKLIIFLILLFYVYRKNEKLFKAIWKNRNYPKTLPIGLDFSLGLIAWFLCFPIVTILNEASTTLLKFILPFKYYDQIAVQFVKTAMTNPLSFLLALLFVLVLAPLIEEFLFRGVLQSSLKKLWGKSIAIPLSSLIFAFFHFHPLQGWGNISLLLSLFVLGLYLGFLYERQGSLWASIGLHMSFNAITALRIAFLPETG